MTQTAEQTIAAAGGQSLFAEKMLQLCQISYDTSGIAKAVRDLAPFRPGGGWHCVWGPTWNLIDSNLAFVAAYYDQGAAAPMFTCVVVRGTDFDIWDPLGILLQIWEDLDPSNPVAAPWPSKYPGATIAGGTYDGLTVIQGLISHGYGLKDWLKLFLAQPGHSRTTMVVTGHSLGGCLTTVVAPWLQTALSVPLVPVTFAAPTAGNPAFASDFGARFPISFRYQNPLDIVPLAYENLPGINDIYLPHGLSIPWEVKYPLEWMESELAGLIYTQPNSLAPMLPANQWLKTGSWFDEGGYQHATTTYMDLIDGKNFGRLPRFTSRRGIGRPAVPAVRTA